MKNIIKYAMLMVGVTVILGNADPASDTNNFMALLEAKLNSFRVSEYPPDIKIAGEQLKNADPCQVFGLFSKYENDPCWIVREQTYRQEVYFANLQPKPEIRQEVVCRLIKAFVDPNSGLSGQASTWLLTFNEKDFNNGAKGIIRKVMEKPGKGTVLICGVANIQEELPHLKELLVDELEYEKRTREPWWFQLSWNARLARARMGVEEDIEMCIDMIEHEVDSTNTFELLGSLGYIRQPQAIESLKRYLESDLRLPQVKLTVPGERYASYVTHILADCLSNFPIEKREGRGYTMEEIELCRKWMSEQTEWKIIR